MIALVRAKITTRKANGRIKKAVSYFCLAFAGQEAKMCSPQGASVGINGWTIMHLWISTSSNPPVLILQSPHSDPGDSNNKEMNRNCRMGRRNSESKWLKLFLAALELFMSNILMFEESTKLEFGVFAVFISSHFETTVSVLVGTDRCGFFERNWFPVLRY